MRNIYKYSLDFNPAYEWFRSQLELGNTLSIELLKSVDFKKGHFFTLLPEEANIKNIYKFNEGGIVPAIEVQEGYEVIPTFNYDLTEIINNQINLKKQSCLFEDVLRSQESNHLEFFRKNRLLFTFEGSIYYIINHSSNTIKSILECVRNSNAFWHFLCVLSNFNHENSADSKLIVNDIIEFCHQATTIVVTAFDGEGFIFWSKNEYNFNFENRVGSLIKNEPYLEKLGKNTLKSSEPQGAWFNEEKNEILFPHLITNQSKKPHWVYQGLDFPDGARLFVNTTNANNNW